MARATERRATRPATKKTVKKAGARPRTKPRAPGRFPTDEIDEFSAMGGVPRPLTELPGADRSFGRSKVQELTWAEFDRQVQALARASVGFKPDAVVGIAHGGVFVGGAVASALKREFFPVRLTRRSRDHGTRGSAQPIADDMPAELAGRRVLVVDDIASSGDSLEFAVRLARARGAKAVATAALVARPGKYEPDYAAFTSDTFYVFPWDYQEVVEDGRFDPEA